MPKLSDNTLLTRAIYPAMQDRESYADAVLPESPDGIEALALAQRIQALTGKKLAKLSPDELETARLTFILGEQYEIGFADSKPGREYEQTALKNANLFREVRLRRWGKTVLEAKLANAQSVSVHELLRTAQR